MKPEQLMWQRLRTLMSPGWQADRHEDTLNAGVPDVSYSYFFSVGRTVQGWIELKTLPDWPKLPETPVRIPHEKRFMRQKAWLRRRGHGCFLLLWIRSTNTWLLFHHDKVGGVGLWNRSELERQSSTSHLFQVPAAMADVL
jgi:hypothetical protein